MLGVIAVSQAGLTISAYLKDLENRGQTAERQHEVEAILTKWNAGESHFATHGAASPPVAAGTKILRAASLDKGGGAAAAAALAPADEMELLKAQLAAMQAENDRLRAAAAAAGGGAAGAGAGADAAAAAAPP
mmetsp:Transcript_12808/g.32817  ORF Transcript_12808/g.32817 Transcript_12808/m.32817 type:complete len:133 (-) Transcript_12808:232-630(-)